MAGRIYDNWAHIDPEQEDALPAPAGAPPRLPAPTALIGHKGELNDIKGGAGKVRRRHHYRRKAEGFRALYNETRALIRELYELRKAENPVISGTETLKIILAATSMPIGGVQPSWLPRRSLDERQNRAPITDHRIRPDGHQQRPGRPRVHAGHRGTRAV